MSFGMDLRFGVSEMKKTCVKRNNQRYLGSEKCEAGKTADQATLLLKKLKSEAEKRRKDKKILSSSGDVVQAKSDEAEHPKQQNADNKIKLNKELQKEIVKKRKRRRDEKNNSEEKIKKKRKDGKDKANNSDSNIHETNLGSPNIDHELSVTMETEESALSSKIDYRLENPVSESDVSGGETEDSDLHNETTAENSEPKNGPHEIGGYTVLGDFKPKSVEKVKRVLPEWLAKPSVVSADISQDQTPVDQVTGLNQHIVDKLKENEIANFFPVQAQIVPAMLSYLRVGYHTAPGGYRPPDICCSAPTGSGKTLAFVLPIVQALMGRAVCQIRALVILPVQDLARQVFGVFQTYCKGTNLKVGLIIGQKTFQIEQQTLVKKRCRGFQSQVDIVVSTPGRLVDHINKTTGFDLRHLRFLVIDEADRMMAEIKQDWLSQVEEAVYTTKYGQGLYPEYTRPLPGHITVDSAAKLQMPLQKLLFSATLSQNPEKLQQLNLFQPRLFTSVVKTPTSSSPAKVKTKGESVGAVDYIQEIGWLVRDGAPVEASIYFNWTDIAPNFKHMLDDV